MATTPAPAPQAPPPTARPGDAYCSNCGYVLTGLIDSARCPECGKPIVEVLTRIPFKRTGRAVRYKTNATLFGLPLIHVALGPMPEQGELKGVARGIIAVGDMAFGGIAVGGSAIGVVAFGGFAAGAATFGGMSVGALTALGGMAVGGFTVGGGSVGVVATGGGSIGVVAQGGGALGVYARGGGVRAIHKLTPRHADPDAAKVFSDLSPLLGDAIMPTPLTFARAALSSVAIATMLALLIVTVVILKLRSARPATGTQV